MTDNTKKQIPFPKAISEQEINNYEGFLFLSQRMQNNKKVHELMRVEKNSIKKIEEGIVIGEKLPVYIKLINRYIFTGKMGAV